MSINKIARWKNRLQEARFRKQPVQTALSVVTKQTYQSDPHPHYVLRCRIGDRNVAIKCSVKEVRRFPVGSELPITFRAAKNDRYDLEGTIDTKRLKREPR